MPSSFSYRQDRYLRISLRLFFVSVAGVGLLGLGWMGTDIDREVGRAIEQPVPFSHQHHAGEMGIDCRYCHQSVETSSYAGMPTAETCMTCHSQIWLEARPLQAVRDSFEQGEPIRWRRLSRMPDFVYFDHSVHVARGFDCVDCHGEVDTMPLVWQSEPHTMKWCLECHRSWHEELDTEVQKGLEVAATVGADERSGGHEGGHALPLKRLENCTVCHR